MTNDITAKVERSEIEMAFRQIRRAAIRGFVQPYIANASYIGRRGLVMVPLADVVAAIEEALSSQRAEGIEEGLDYGPGSPWSEGYHSGHAAGWRAGVRADILRLLRADLAEEDAERHAQRIAVIDDALTQDAG